MKLIFNEDKTEVAIIKSEVVLDMGEKGLKNSLRIYVDPKKNPDLDIVVFFTKKADNISIDNGETVKTYEGYKVIAVNEHMTELSIQIAITMEKEVNTNV
jgi:hypothetical protein